LNADPSAKLLGIKDVEVPVPTAKVVGGDPAATDWGSRLSSGMGAATNTPRAKNTLIHLCMRIDNGFFRLNMAPARFREYEL
jgi:hypothetical protein